MHVAIGTGLLRWRRGLRDRVPMVMDGSCEG